MAFLFAVVKTYCLSCAERLRTGCTYQEVRNKLLHEVVEPFGFKSSIEGILFFLLSPLDNEFIGEGALPSRSSVGNSL